MDRSRANLLALRSIISIFDSLRDCQVEVDGKPVSVQVERTGERPEGESEGVSGVGDETWPETLRVRCTWEGGKVTFALDARGYKKGIGLSLQLRPGRKLILWVSVTTPLERADGEEDVPMRGQMGLRKHKREEGEAVAYRKATDQLRRLVKASGMPLLRRSVELFRIRVSDGAVLPSPAEALERILRVALYKLDFVSRRPNARAERGAALIEVPSLDGLVDGDEDDDSQSGEERRYWVGGFLAEGGLAARSVSER